MQAGAAVVARGGDDQHVALAAQLHGALEPLIGLAFGVLDQLPAADVDQVRPGFDRQLDPAGQVELRDLRLVVGEDGDDHPPALRREPLDRALLAAEDHAGHVRAVRRHRPADGGPLAAEHRQDGQVGPREARVAEVHGPVQDGDADAGVALGPLQEAVQPGDLGEFGHHQPPSVWCVFADSTHTTRLRGLDAPDPTGRFLAVRDSVPETRKSTTRKNDSTQG